MNTENGYVFLKTPIYLLCLENKLSKAVHQYETLIFLYLFEVRLDFFTLPRTLYVDLTKKLVLSKSFQILCLHNILFNCCLCHMSSLVAQRL